MLEFVEHPVATLGADGDHCLPPGPHHLLLHELLHLLREVRDSQTGTEEKTNKTEEPRTHTLISQTDRGGGDREYWTTVTKLSLASGRDVFLSHSNYYKNLTK